MKTDSVALTSTTVPPPRFELTERRIAAAVTFVICAGSALFFCSKGVFVKSAYQLGADPLTLLGLRMIIALPIFLTALWISERKATVPMNRRTFGKLVGLGFLGYYLSSIVNFSGLQYISVGLERMVLYTYPTLVVIGSVLFFKTSLNPIVVVAIILTYAGIGIAWHGEAKSTGTPAETVLGVALVFLSALTYASFMLMSGRMVKQLGGIRFTSYVVSISCGFVILHFLCARSPAELLGVSNSIMAHGAILAVFGTALPSFLLGIGLARAGAQKFAIISTVGPVGTVVLAWLVLGESMDATGLVGLAMTMTGGVAVTLMKD
ncbi:MAG: drug/metabolite transporter (DMT)-like permease [Verrucomicrobiales bacterium]|jgi:drug/metabolite transporter (DMT)-like permease